MRTPAAMIVGMVLAPCGLVLILTATTAPNWRTLGSLVLKPIDVQYNQGIWDICQETTTNQNRQCGLTNDAYFNLQVVQVARALMIISLVVNGLGIGLAAWGVRCWEDMPHFLMAAIGGIVIFIAGILCLIPIAWYNNQMYNLLSSDTDPSNKPSIYVGYCLVLGYLGSCMEIIAGCSLMLCFVPPCKKCFKNKGKPTTSMYYSKKQMSSKKNGNPSQVYSIQNEYTKDHYPSNYGYSIQNDNYKHEPGRRMANSAISSPRSYTNPMDVTAGEHHRSNNRPGSQLSSLPCDSDLL